MLKKNIRCWLGNIKCWLGMWDVEKKILDADVGY